MLFDGSNKLDERAFSKVFKTLAAMANHAPGAVGYVLVGVADDAKTAARIEQLYSVKPLKYYNFLIPGIDHEAYTLPKKLDSYFQGVTQRLSASPMSGWAKAQIARDVRMIRYFDRSILVLKVEAGTEPCDFDGKYYERHGPNVEEVPQTELASLFRRFFSTPS